jgi:hypothetical protein
MNHSNLAQLRRIFALSYPIATVARTGWSAQALSGQVTRGPLRARGPSFGARRRTGRVRGDPARPGGRPGRRPSVPGASSEVFFNFLATHRKARLVSVDGALSSKPRKNNYVRRVAFAERVCLRGTATRVFFWPLQLVSFRSQDQSDCPLLCSAFLDDPAHSATHRSRSLKLSCICSSANPSAKKRSAASPGRLRVRPSRRSAAISAA